MRDMGGAPSCVASTARTAASGRGAEPARRLLLAATNHELEQQVVVGVDDQDRAVCRSRSRRTVAAGWNYVGVLPSP
jgi:hypothetical protein